MAHHARILQERMLALEYVIIRAAYADTARPDQRAAIIGMRGGPRFDLQLSRLRTDKGVYGLHAMFSILADKKALAN
jgi:hypothetical protein